MDVDQPLSPTLLEKVSYLGTLLKSFRQGETAIDKLLDMTLGRKRIERITERIGIERVAESDQDVEAFQALSLMEKVAIDGKSGRSGRPHAPQVSCRDGRWRTISADSEECRCLFEKGSSVILVAD